jgi:integrase
MAVVGSGNQGTRIKKSFHLKRDADVWFHERQVEHQSEESSYIFTPETTIEEMLEQYLKSLDTRTKSHRADINRSVLEVTQSLGIHFLKDLTSQQVHRYRNRSDQSPRTINKKLGYLKSMCSHLESEGWIDQSPLRNLKKKPSIKREKRALDKIETKELLRAVHAKSPNVWFPIIFTGLRLALRKGELLTLEFSDLDFDNKKIYIRDKPHLLILGEPHNCKWGSSRTLPLYPELEKLFQSLPRTSNFIFPTSDGSLRWNNVSRDFATAISCAKINRVKEITPHSLRHTRISQLICYEKCHIKEVQALAGHSNVATTFGYAHLLGGTDDLIKADSSLPKLDEIMGDELM